MTARQALAAAAVAGAAVALLAGCSGTHSSAGSSAAEQTGAAPARSAPHTRSASDVLLGTRDRVYSAQLTVHAHDVAAVADAALAYAYQQGGEIDGDDRTSTAGGSADVTVRVVPQRYQQTLDGLAHVRGAQETSRTSSVTDVTTKVADVGARLASQQASVTRVRTLMAHAANIAQVVELEGDLASREADLESLQAQQRALQQQVGLATIVLHVRPAPSAAAHRGKAAAPHGFLAGLGAGWRFFGAVVTALLTALGALLPFLAVALVVGVPAYALLRRRRRRTASDISA